MRNLLPTTPKPERIEVSSITGDFEQVPHSLNRVSISRGGQRWQFNLVWPPLPRATIAPIHAFLLSRRGRSENFLVRLPVLSSPRGYGDASGSVRRYENHLQQSNDFQHSDWTKVNATYGGASPDIPERTSEGGTGQRWDRSAGSAVIWQPGKGGVQNWQNGRNNFSIHAKYAGADAFQIALLATTSMIEPYVKWNWSAGVPVFAAASAPLVYGADDYGNGWYRFFLKAEGSDFGVTGEPLRVRIYPDPNSTGGPGVYLYGAMLHSSYTYPGWYRTTTTAYMPITWPVGEYLPTHYGPGGETLVRAGDFLRVDGGTAGGGGKLYQAVEDSDCDAWGIARTRITPRIMGRVDYSTFCADEVEIWVRLLDDVEEIAVGRGDFVQLSASMMEVPAPIPVPI